MRICLIVLCERREEDRLRKKKALASAGFLRKNGLWQLERRVSMDALHTCAQSGVHSALSCSHVLFWEHLAPQALLVCSAHPTKLHAVSTLASAECTCSLLPTDTGICHADPSPRPGLPSSMSSFSLLRLHSGLVYLLWKPCRCT